MPFDYERIEDDAPIVSDPAIKQAVWNVLDNAAEASPHWVGLSVTREGDTVAVRVSDRGPGFTSTTLAQVGRPQQSTKGEGHGVGLFWCRASCASWAAGWKRGTAQRVAQR